MAALVYGGGLRLMECLRLRVKDIDFEYRQLVIRDAKGQQDRVTVLPQNCSNRYATISSAYAVYMRTIFAKEGGAAFGM